MVNTTTPVLKVRNTGIVICDDQEATNRRIAPQLAQCQGKGKALCCAKGKEKLTPNNVLQILKERNGGVVIREDQGNGKPRCQAKGKENQTANGSVLSNRAAAQRARREREKMSNILLPSITNRYPNEYLNSLDPPGLPPFKLELKVGCPIMLRNIAPADGLCNGTRLVIVRMASRTLEARILTGDKAGNLVFIPRISLAPSSNEMPFHMTRRQFPVRLAYAMTINKSQGQSVKFVGIDLRNPVFSHGQLYVALSRCTSADRVRVILPADNMYTTTNIVYPEVLL